VISLGIVLLIPPADYFNAFAKEVSDWEFWKVIITVFSIYLMGETMDKSGNSSRFVRAVESLFPEPRVSIALMPAIIGLLPMPGGAMFSAPMVKDLAKSDPTISNEDGLVFNYWFRHAMEFFWPLYPALVIASGISRIRLNTLVLWLMPIGVVALVTGYLLMIRKPIKIRYSRSALKELLISAWPIIAVIILVILNQPGWLSVLGTSLVYLLLNKNKKKVLLAALKYKTFILLLTVFFYKDLVEIAEVPQSMGSELIAWSIPPLTLVILLPFLMGFMTGVTQAGVGLSLPLILSMGNGYGTLATTILAYTFAVVGVLVSPVHLCLVLTSEYFKVEYPRIIKRISVVTLLSVAAGIVVFVLLLSQLELTQLKTQKAILLLALTMTGGENELKEYSVVLSNVTKIFDDSFTAVDNVSLTIEQGEFFSLLGPSGCGKTTILRMIAGFEDPTFGNITLNGKNIIGTPPNEREVNTVFQNYALFPHLNVFENIAFSLRLRNEPEDQVRRKVKEMIDLTRLNGHVEKMPSQLSGGQKQRVAIARALVGRPTVLLLDEPLAALDAKLRQHMLVELDTIHDEVGITFIYVTHDQSEAMSISDHVAVMNEGEIIQLGTPFEVYESPVNAFVANFIGETNFFTGNVVKVEDEYFLLDTEKFGEIWFYKDMEVLEGQEIQVSLRPEKVKVTRDMPVAPEGVKLNVLKGVIDETIYLGNQTKYTVAIGQSYLKAFKQHVRYLFDEVIITWKDDVYVWWFADDSYVLRETGGVPVEE
jgi:integral membrane protein (TIGR00529 family)